MSNIDLEKLAKILEAAILSAGRPLAVDKLQALFVDEAQPSVAQLRQALVKLQEAYQDRGVELVEVASGYRFQARQEYATWVSRLWEEKPPRYSRALLETLALIAYRQPLTRADIEEVRGVSVSSQIIKTLQEREWIRVVGHRDVPGRPALFATTKQFLDYFNLHSLEELPSLAEIQDLDALSPELQLEGEMDANNAAKAGSGPGVDHLRAAQLLAAAVSHVLHPAGESQSAADGDMENDPISQKSLARESLEESQKPSSVPADDEPTLTTSE